MRSLRLSEIYIYPIKSLGGISLNDARVLPKGLQYDRRWMLIDENGTCMTQRTVHQMALFKVSIVNGDVVVRKKEGGEVKAQAQFSLEAAPAGSGIKSKVWDDEVEVQEVDQSISAWFTKEMGMKCRLVKFPEPNPRRIDPKFKIADDHVGLADAYPFHIIGQSTLDDLNARLKEPLSINRFRPNFVFTGGEPFEEDNWRDFRINTNRFVGVKPCARCVLTTIDQETAARGAEPLLTLSNFRKKNNKILFGQNLIAVDYGQITVGDEIEIDSRSEPLETKPSEIKF